MFVLTNGSENERIRAQKRLNAEAQSVAVSTLLPKRRADSHKGDYGRAAIVAGSEEYSGAAWLAMSACLRAGAGYTALFTPQTLVPYFYFKEPEALLIPSNEGGRYAFNEERMRQVCGYSAVAYGMGMGESEETARGACFLLAEYTGKLILDADALNALAKYRKTELKNIFQTKKCEVVITPHSKEFSRLIGKSVEEIINNHDIASAFSKEYGVTVLLKNAISLITDGARSVYNVSGCSGQAKGGSGDVLSGVLAGLCAQGANVFDGACAAAYLTGKTAELVGKEKSEYAMLPRDVIEALPKAFLFVTENTHE